MGDLLPDNQVFRILFWWEVERPLSNCGSWRARITYLPASSASKSEHFYVPDFDTAMARIRSLLAEREKEYGLADRSRRLRSAAARTVRGGNRSNKKSLR